ncbi:MAG: hypothetical protein WBE84_03410, partial [Xanthobacteraceae bacterium]
MAIPGHRTPNAIADRGEHVANHRNDMPRRRNNVVLDVECLGDKRIRKKRIRLARNRFAGCSRRHIIREWVRLRNGQ